LRPDDALVAVHTAAITPSELGWVPTWTNADGTDRTPVIPGHEVAGEIVAVGVEVSEERIGERVFGLTDFYRDGAAAQFVAVHAGDLGAWPAGVEAAEIAALPLSGLTAWQALIDHGEVRAGMTVLVHGAAGGVGTFVVQLAHIEGARVVAVAADADREFLLGLGSDIVIDRHAEPFDDVLRGLHLGVDLVIDTVGGDIVDRSFEILPAGGRLVSVAPSSRTIAERDRRGRFFVVTPDRRELALLAQALVLGSMRAVVDRRFPLAQAREAYRYGVDHHPRGKVVLTVL
jgi:NADPH:quinone reductase-like Zn-dependent oxidoreductase